MRSAKGLGNEEIMYCSSFPDCDVTDLAASEFHVLVTTYGAHNNHTVNTGAQVLRNLFNLLGDLSCGVINIQVNMIYHAAVVTFGHVGRRENICHKANNGINLPATTRTDKRRAAMMCEEIAM